MVVREPEWLTGDELRAWRGFTLMNMQLQAVLAAELEGISMQDYAVLAHLSDQPEQRSRPVDIGRELGWEKSRTSHHLRRMEQRGLIERFSCPTDQRGWLIGMTDTGKAASEQAAPAHVESVRRHFIDLLSPAQIATLADVADTVTSHLDDLPCRPTE